ncbi:MAG: hypothetical protein QF681_08825, partial [Vicinamibacterales bacterium]|nr:hypothetical protein [Vicinamibacterales bacterium]
MSGSQNSEVRSRKTTRRAAACVITLVIGVALLAAVPRAQERKFYPDDPLVADNDKLDVPDEPAEIELSDLFDRFGHIMADLGDATRGEAQNANTLDEVPDSSWFTNRHGVQRMSRAAMVPETRRFSMDGLSGIAPMRSLCSASIPAMRAWASSSRSRSREA